MAAKVHNRFDGDTELKALTVDYLELQLTKPGGDEAFAVGGHVVLYLCGKIYIGPMAEE